MQSAYDDLAKQRMLQAKALSNEVRGGKCSFTSHLGLSQLYRSSERVLDCSMCATSNKTRMISRSSSIQG